MLYVNGFAAGIPSKVTPISACAMPRICKVEKDVVRGPSLADTTPGNVEIKDSIVDVGDCIAI
ncbi:hypothetical protein ASY01nite_03770 [Acetobacter syzygii]|nr:hypothetical protein Absy_027_097 [Acetobacter syzygii]GEL55311.1 hypothetical protein ASY01nite_03770 [Acetobacter syzygii]